jgi:hypothetical protein
MRRSDANAKCRWYTPFPLSQQSAELNETETFASDQARGCEDDARDECS